MTLLIALLACSPSSTTDDSVDSTADTGVDTADSGAPFTEDEARVRALIAGEAELDAVLREVAWAGGFPVQTAGGGWLFLAEGTGRTLAGDHSGWVEEAMTDGDGFAWIEVAIEAPQGSGYKLGPGLTADPWARSYTHDAFGELSYVRPPSDRPRLDRWPELAGEGLAPRDLRVYVPPGAGPFDVLYAHDGQNLFDPGAIWGGWQLLDALAAQPPMLLVGIDNTADRIDEYTHTTDAAVGGGGNAATYAQLVHGHIRPHVESTYGSSGTDGLIGSSLGGLVSLVIADAQPAEWDFVASMSGTLGFGRLESDNELIVQRWAIAPRGPVIYVDSGGGPGANGCEDPDGDGYPVDDPDDSDNYCANRDFADRLAAAGYAWDSELVHWYEADAAHNEAAWAARVHRPLALFTGLD